MSQVEQRLRDTFDTMIGESVNELDEEERKVFKCINIFILK
jgi:hypothetical protein